MVLWHGGEPLMTGHERFKRYLNIFSEFCPAQYYQHSIQTNGSLLDEKWCDLIMDYNIRVGVSLDGNATHNGSRKNWNSQDIFDETVLGIQKLRERNIPFGIIAVINRFNVNEPETMYNFLVSLKPNSISLNFEENEGANVGRAVFSRDQIDNFWNRLFKEWRKHPAVSIRQFRDSLRTMNRLINESYVPRDVRRNLYPTIDTEGNVVLLSPEFISVSKKEREKFIVGNVLQKDLESIVAEGSSAWYIEDFIQGTEMCAKSCGYFAFCHGGQASNKFFENGSIKTTETQYCYASRISPTQTILDNVNATNQFSEKETV